jgi:predicted nuclease with TOPRIM domain
MAGKNSDVLYSQIDYESALSGKKDVLEIERSFLNVMQKIENYQNLRKREFVIKLKLKNTLKEAKDKIVNITESLPHPHGTKAIKMNNIETEKKFKESKKSKIEQDLMEIQSKLEELSK